MASAFFSHKSKLPAQRLELLAGRKPSCGVRQARGITAEDEYANDFMGLPPDVQ
jgi:hypothetical protein